MAFDFLALTFSIDPAVAALVGAMIGFVGSIFAVMVPSYYNRPKISISENGTISEDRNVEVLIAKGLEMREYYTTKIKFENNGRTAAENCKASFDRP
jgi:hypothetical protein